jgi:hypothetical protein
VYPSRRDSYICDVPFNPLPFYWPLCGKLQSARGWKSNVPMHYSVYCSCDGTAYPGLKPTMNTLEKEPAATTPQSEIESDGPHLTNPSPHILSPTRLHRRAMLCRRSGTLRPPLFPLVRSSVFDKNACGFQHRPAAGRFAAGMNQIQPTDPSGSRNCSAYFGTYLGMRY